MKNFIIKILDEWYGDIMERKKEKKSADYLHRTATTAYPCCLPALGESAGAGRVRPAGRKDKEK
jgi:hypothetical protein